jgi:hypothetical protein
MGKYQVHAFCDIVGCGAHKLSISLAVDDVDVEEAPIGDVYARRELPPAIAEPKRNGFVSPASGKLTRVRSNEQIFLVRAL